MHRDGLGHRGRRPHGQGPGLLLPLLLDRRSRSQALSVADNRVVVILIVVGLRLLATSLAVTCLLGGAGAGLFGVLLEDSSSVLDNEDNQCGLD